MSGSGFFTVNVTDKNGNVHTRYSRNGQFTLTKDGLLVDSEGNAVQGQGGDIHIPTDAKNISISVKSVITADGQNIDTLKLVDFDDYDYLKKYGDTMYEPVDGATEKDVSAQTIQGYTEQSNVNVVKEMVDMITITRAYEASQKVIHSYDSMLDKSVNQVGALNKKFIWRWQLMMRSLWTAASGMIGEQSNLDVIANNLSNINTTGYKTQKANFKSLIYQNLQA